MLLDPDGVRCDIVRVKSQRILASTAMSVSPTVCKLISRLNHFNLGLWPSGFPIYT